MNLELGIKSDPVLYRYTYKWLFSLMQDLDIRYLQLGSFFELYSLEDAYFTNLRSEAEKYNIRIKSCFTAHRELGGFLSGNTYMEKAAFKNYKRYIEVASLLGADYAGSNPGAVYRDQMETKDAGIKCYLDSMKKLMVYGREKGLKGLTIEPMSSMAEPPSSPEEISFFMKELNLFYSENIEKAIPAYFCGDISHGVANEQKKIIYSNMELFKLEIPSMVEFHFKNTDSIFNKTFGFSPEEQKVGIINLKEIKKIIDDNQDKWPVEEVVGYLEMGGPKLGRDYTDNHLGDELTQSVKAIKAVYNK